MSWPKPSLVLTCVALTISLALAADWLAAEWLDFGSPLARFCLFTLSLGFLATWLVSAFRRQREMGDEALAELELLSHLDNRRLSIGAFEPRLADLRPGTAWVKTVRRLHDRLGGLARRLDELERERALFEGRARRHEAQTQRMNSILSALAEPVLVIDKRDELVLANSSANALFAIDADNVEQRALATLVHCEKLVELLTQTRQCKAFTQRSCEVEITDRDGAAHWYRVTARNIPTQPGQSDPDGTSQGVVALLHDVSAQKTIQKRNAELVSAVSHEMRTPLAGIKAYAELLADGEAQDEQTEKQFLNVIGAQTERLQSLVDDLVELARIEADLAGAARRVQPLDALLEEAVRVVRPQAEAKGVELGVELKGADACVLADGPMITQAALHLLSNAVKYTPRGGRVFLRGGNAGQGLAFEVEDTGVGLSREDCQKVFEKFYRVPKDKDMAGGTGLGLPLVRHIVEDVHGGRIAVQSTPGQGSRFSVFLPCAQPKGSAAPA
jgi:two-component system phosphate regulon sensor histidine kinase PhoR